MYTSLLALSMNFLAIAYLLIQVSSRSFFLDIFFPHLFLLYSNSLQYLAIGASLVRFQLGSIAPTLIDRHARTNRFGFRFGVFVGFDDGDDSSTSSQAASPPRPSDRPPDRPPDRGRALLPSSTLRQATSSRDPLHNEPFSGSPMREEEGRAPTVVAGRERAAEETPSTERVNGDGMWR